MVKQYQWGNEGPDRATGYWTTTSITFRPAGSPAPQPEYRGLPRKIYEKNGPQFVPYSSRLELRNRDEVIETLKSNYPPLLQAAGVGGTALVWLHVQKDGSVAEARIIDSSGRSELDDAALRVSRTLRFVPAQSEGKPVPVRLQLPITFKAQ